MRCKLMSRVLMAAFMGLNLAGFCQAAEPDATLVLSAESVAAGVGYSWGRGTLTFRGQTYPVTVEGISVITIGVARADATATVYNVKNLDDFNGTYAAAGVGATVAGGGFAIIMRNQNGVELHLVGTTQGLDVKFAVEGVKVALAESVHVEPIQ